MSAVEDLRDQVKSAINTALALLQQVNSPPFFKGSLQELIKILQSSRQSLKSIFKSLSLFIHSHLAIQSQAESDTPETLDKDIQSQSLSKSTKKTHTNIKSTRIYLSQLLQSYQWVENSNNPDIDDEFIYKYSASLYYSGSLNSTYSSNALHNPRSGEASKTLQQELCNSVAVKNLQQELSKIAACLSDAKSCNLEVNPLDAIGKVVAFILPAYKDSASTAAERLRDDLAAKHSLAEEDVRRQRSPLS